MHSRARPFSQGDDRRDHAQRGAYYVVLFNFTDGQYAVSRSSLAWNDTASISTSEFDIITDYFAQLLYRLGTG